jgi:CRP-like cAMP-binding protein
MFYSMIAPYITQPKSIKLKRGDIIYHEGDKAQNLYFIKSGLVGLFHISEDGKETFFRLFGQDYILGHRSFLAEENYHASAIALKAAEIISISGEEYNQICSDHPELNRTLLNIMAKDLGSAELRMASFLEKSAQLRIIETLVYLKLRYPDHVWTRKEVAEYSGSTYETVTRVMTKLENMELIRKEGRDFVIIDQDQLLALETL